MQNQCYTATGRKAIANEYIHRPCFGVDLFITVHIVLLFQIIMRCKCFFPVMFAYEQCLLCLGHHPDIWIEAASYLEQSSKLLAEKGVRTSIITLVFSILVSRYLTVPFNLLTTTEDFCSMPCRLPHVLTDMKSWYWITYVMKHWSLLKKIIKPWTISILIYPGLACQREGFSCSGHFLFPMLYIAEDTTRKLCLQSLCQP